MLLVFSEFNSNYSFNSTKPKMMKVTSSISEDVVVETDTPAYDDHAKRMTRNQSFRSSTGTSAISDEDPGICPLHLQKMLFFCLEDLVKVCHKCLLYGNHKFHESLDLEDEENM